MRGRQGEGEIQRKTLTGASVREVAHMHQWNRSTPPPVGAGMNPLPLTLDSYDLAAAERQLCAAALDAGGGIVPAAQLLGVTRHALKRRIIKHRIEWPRKDA